MARRRINAMHRTPLQKLLRLFPFVFYTYESYQISIHTYIAKDTHIISKNIDTLYCFKGVSACKLFHFIFMLTFIVMSFHQHFIKINGQQKCNSICICRYIKKKLCEVPAMIFDDTFSICFDCQ